ncbi:type VI secretion system-associated protein TagF [Candidatus Marithrix sp. Canyon 246]|uniref:type VI secretion system-associated protein TagF n=1 Tax=Candidatus Marithrix sp. Canyon 246 TaxID=1827136 RepID=UPI000849F149|nr:type VI secretion system-associated protein TagF [Candidatus Marithrix sp. Canyon 246]
MNGFYGKLPCKGDFIRRGLAKDFVQPWDTWLQQGLACSREQLGKDWDELYLVSPIWHFLLSAGLCGSSSWLGLMMPSVDKVGRYFPLTVAIKLPFQISENSLTDTAIVNWFAQADDLALSTLEEPFDFDQFVLDISKLKLENLDAAKFKGRYSIWWDEENKRILYNGLPPKKFFYAFIS